MPQQNDDGGPAFPQPVERSQGEFGTTDAYPGMSLRDYFAAQAHQGILAGRNRHIDSMSDGDVADMAQTTYLFANAMLAARKAVRA